MGVIKILVLFAVVIAALAIPEKKNNVIIDNYLYFTDTSVTLRNHTEALDYCRSQDAELAKVKNAKIYNILRVALPTIATYWIDGVDRNDPERFVLQDICDPATDVIDYSQLSEDNVVLPSRSCLSLVKGNNATTSRILAQDCVGGLRVLCAFRLDDCPIATTAPDATTAAATASTTPDTTTAAAP